MPDPINNTYGSMYTGTSQGNSYVPQYNNLPQGISNAGGGQNSAYVGAVQPNSLVSTQLSQLLDSNSPYMQQARRTGIDQANARGMLNSSMAAGNSQAAAIQSGLPIAQQDASTYNNQQLVNQQYLNQILQQRMSDQNQANISAGNNSTQLAIADANNRGQLARQRENLAYAGEQAGLGRDFARYMDQLGYGNQSGLLQQQYQYGLGQGAFNLAGTMLTNNQSFRNQAGLRAMDNPSIMGNPQAFGGWMDWMGGDYNNSISNLLRYAMGGGYG